jgi:hypothetical protein
MTANRLMSSVFLTPPLRSQLSALLKSLHDFSLILTSDPKPCFFAMEIVEHELLG